MKDDEFFIGWQGKAPPETGSYLKGLVVLGLGVVLLVAVLVPMLQGTVATDATFDFGNHREFSGVLVEDPVPMLVGDDDMVRLLVNPLKHGFDADLAAKFHLKHVTLRGTLISRGGDEMVEVLPESVTATDGTEEATHPLGPSIDLGETELRGEIVDSKCYLGVMNPGNLKPHRACAVNCIQGGIPPVLLVRDRDGAATYVLLVGENGEALNNQVLKLVAEPVVVTGRLKKQGKQLVLYADVEGIRLE